MDSTPQGSIARGFLAQFSVARQAHVHPLTHGLVAIEKALELQRDNLPLLVPVGLGLGITAWQMGGATLLPVWALMALGMLCLAAIAGLGSYLGRVLISAVLLSALGYAAITAKSALVAPQMLKKPWVGTLNARIETVEDVSARGLVRYVLETGEQSDLPARIRVNVPIDKHGPAFQPGAVIQVKARLMPPPGPALPRSYDFARQAWFWGIGATGSALGTPILVTPATGEAAYWSDARESLASHIRAAMPGDSGAVGAALLVGARGAISEEDAQALRNSGMAHLLSVSGLHLTAVVGGAFFLLTRFLALFPWFALRWRVPIVAAAGSAIIAIGYTLLTGSEVPTVRSCFAALMVLAALAMGREALSLRLLAAGASFVLLFWPEALAGPSFQLSFAAVATIILLHGSPKLQQWTMRRDEPLRGRIFRFIASTLFTGLAIELVLMPIALFHFHKSGLYGAAANIIAIPLTTFFIMPLQIIGLLADFVGLGFPFWWLAGQGVFAIVWLAHTVGDAPGAVLALPAMPAWAFGATVLGGLWIAIVAGKGRWLGFVPVFIGATAMATAPRPDILVTGDGKHLAVADGDGALVLLRPRAGDYAVSLLGENAALTVEPTAIDDWPRAQCSPDICTFVLRRGDRDWTILATRSDYLVPTMELAAACKRVDIAISERFLPWRCKPRWFKADRAFLQQSGGLAIYFDPVHVETVAGYNGHQPWSRLGTVNPEPKPSLPDKPGPAPVQ